MKRYLVAAASFAIGGAVLAPQPASALVSYAGGLVYDSSIDQTGTGFGNVPRLITVKGNPNKKTTESGCVSAAGGVFGIGSTACDGSLVTNVGGDEPSPQADNQKYGIPTLDELGWVTAADIGLVFNPDEQGGGPISVDDITLKFYDGAGLLIAQVNGSQAFLSSDPGNGKAGFAFVVTGAAQTGLQTNVFDLAGSSNFRIALEGTNSQFGGGPDSWFDFDRIPDNGGGGGGPGLPESATWMMLIIGFGTMGGSLRYRRREQAALT